MVLEFLLRCHARTAEPAVLQAVSLTCERMARGGMYDQLGGGFARYSVDSRWIVPHFEKMLYDNALLARVYLHWWRQTGDPLAAPRRGRDVFVPASATSRRSRAASPRPSTPTPRATRGARTSGRPEQVGAYAAGLFSVTEQGTFEHGSSVLMLLRDPDDPARYAAERERLLAIRSTRVQPSRDDKIVAAWNGMAIAALAECGALLDRPDWVDAARAAASLLVGVHVVDGRLLRTSRDGVAGTNAGVLDDYALVADGLLVLHQVTGEVRWLEVAGSLLDVVLDRFGDPASGAFFDTADDAETLLRRPQDPSDNATPSGAAAAAGALLTYAALTGSTRHRQAAERAMAALAPFAGRHPRFAGHALGVAEALVAGPVEVAVVDRPDLLAIARRTPSAGAVVVGTGSSPLLADRPEPAAYVCRGFVCERPTTDAATLVEQLGVVTPPPEAARTR